MLTQGSTLGGDRGWIINISSILGLVGMSGASAYAATKGAVLQMTKVLLAQIPALRTSN